MGALLPNPQKFLELHKKEPIMDTLQMIIKDAEVKIDFTAGKFKTFKRAEITKGEKVHRNLF